MERIRTSEELRSAWELARMIEQNIDNCEYADVARDYLIDVKRTIRKYRDKRDAYIVKDYGIDGYIELAPLPEQIRTEQAAEEYFDQAMRLEYRPTYYDCTGQLFTGWHKLVNRHGRWYVYHRICCDC